MAKRAAVCIGVDRAEGMTPLQAAAIGAKDFGAWAASQGAEATILTDEAPGSRVTVERIFDAIEPIVTSRAYSKLVVYFSGHGILLAPGAEFWLLSRAPGNPNEAVNLLRSIEDARNSAIPHVIFVSGACRSAANTPLLRAVTGGLIFPPQPPPAESSEIDLLFATRPGDPAYEVAEADAIQAYRGLFTDCLLDVVSRPPGNLIEAAVEDGVEVKVLSTRQLKAYLETKVPAQAAAVNIQLNQKPEVRPGTALPKYFARVEATRAVGAPPSPPAPTVDDALAALRTGVFTQPGVPASPAKSGADYAAEIGLTREVERIANARGRGHFETQTGFSVHGAGVRAAHARLWAADPAFPEPTDPNGPTALHVRLHDKGSGATTGSSIVFEFDGGTGAVLPVLPGFIGSIVVDNGRVVSSNYVPSDQSWRYAEYQSRAEELDRMKAFAAVASRNGRFEVDGEKAAAFASRFRQAKGIDPVMGLYAAYAYAQAGKYDDVYSVFSYILEDEYTMPVPFDITMFALRREPNALVHAGARVAPFCPILSQGWALLMPGDAMHHAVHQRLRPHLLPSLFTTLDDEGTAIARDAVLTGEET